MKLILEDVLHLIEETKIKKGMIHTLYSLFKRGIKPHQIINRDLSIYKDNRYR